MRFRSRNPDCSGKPVRLNYGAHKTRVTGNAKTNKAQSRRGGGQPVYKHIRLVRESGLSVKSKEAVPKTEVSERPQKLVF
jgi:hypothetical protein